MKSKEKPKPRPKPVRPPKSLATIDRERREKQGDIKPGGAMSWRPLSLKGARAQGQGELFPGHSSVDPLVAEVKRLKKRRKRQKDQPGVVLHD
jgi:hypothetical protein